MFEAFMNLLLVLMAAAVTGIWIAALADSDGKCEEDDCGNCPFPEDCPIRKMRNERNEKLPETVRKTDHGNP